MKKLLSLLLLTTLASGCARHYDMTLTNGVKVSNVTRPHLDKEGGRYIYKDVTGHEREINASRVTQISPHSNKNDQPWK